MTPKLWLLTLIVFLLGVACLVVCQPRAPVFEPTWRPLFNGKDLTGWQPVGSAKWTVQDGLLIGEQDNGQVGDLLTKDDFDNFELSVTFKVAWPANSGIWFRKPVDRTGYQYDILDLKEYGCTVGSLYSDGFLAQNKDESLLRPDDWNTATILADGTHLVLTLNGTKTADLTDGKYTTGRIGFQVHGGGQYANMKILVREARLRRIIPEREAAAGAKNAQCFVCHLDYQKEELALTHKRNGVACADCHGASKGHIDDEDRRTAPDRIIPHDKVAEFCRTCHTALKKCPSAKPPAEGPDRACTECHGKHKLDLKPQR